MFHELIEDIANRVPGVNNVFLAGTDGLVVTKLKELEQDEILIVEATTLLNECNRLGEEMGSGLVSGFTFSFKQHHLAVQMVNEEYFLLGSIESAEALGKLKYLLKIKALECYVNVT